MDGAAVQVPPLPSLRRSWLFPEARITAVLASLARNAGERLTVADIVAVLRDRAFALLVVLLGLPNCLPMPPPIPFVCGLLLGLVAAQLAAGRATPWLPQTLLRRSIPQDAVERAVTRALPVLHRLERWSKPRIAFLESPVALRLIGLVLIALALGLLVAAPVIGQIPLGVAVCLVGLGLVERDGMLVVAGFVVGVVGLALSLGFIYAVFAGLEAIF
jgi:hypothetical protein